jgi:hypothetical protein
MFSWYVVGLLAGMALWTIMSDLKNLRDRQAVRVRSSS